MTSTTTVNTGQLVQWLLEYGQRVRDIQERAWVYSHSSYVKKGLPLLHEATNGPNQIISQNFASISQLLAELHRVLGSLTLRSYPDLLHQYMDTFCGAVKAGLLLEDVPRKAAAQMVQLACQFIDKEVAGQLRTATCDPIFTEPSMVLYMRKIFQATMPRIAQILELVVGPALIVADNCQGVAAAGLLEMTQHPQQHQRASGVAATSSDGTIDGAATGEMEASPAMGMFGMTRQQVYPFLRHRETIRQWGILGFLIFPGMLNQPNSAQRLSNLLADGFALHLYKDRLKPVHELMLQHLGSYAYTNVETSSAISTGALSPRSAGMLGGLLGKGMAMIGGVSRLRKSLTEDDASHEHRQPHPLFVEAAGAAAIAAPLQHRMWRAYVTGQLRNIHAACAASPSRIPGQLDMLLAALSLGREELLWFCRRQEYGIPSELQPILASRGVVSHGYSCVPTTEDALQALQLLSAMDAMHRLLVEHHSPLCKQIKDANGADFQAHVVSNTPRVEFRLRQGVAQVSSGTPAAAASAAGASGLQPFKDLTDLLRSVLLSSAPPADAPARVSSACGIWIYVSLQLASADPPLKAAKVLQYAENTRYLDVMQKSLEAARLLYEGPLLHASAADLAPGLQGPRLEPLRRAIKSALCCGRVEHMQAALCAMQGLHWLLPARAEAYAAATSASAANNASVLLARTSMGSSAAAAGRSGANETTAATGAAAASPGPRPQSSRPQAMPDDLPNSCMKDVVECLKLLLAPVVTAPLRSTASVTNVARPMNIAHARNGGPGIIRGAISRPKERESSNGGRSLTPERVRQEAGSSTATVAEGPLSRNLQQLGLAEQKASREELEGQHAFLQESGADPAALPPAADLAARLMPVMLALDNGRMLLADSRGVDALSMCRAHLLDAIRENFSQLIFNTGAAITQVVVPIPSVHLGPLRLYIEVVAMLQPHLTTELLPELARLLLHQTTAATLQTIGLEAISVPMRISHNNIPPPSTSAEAGAPTTDGVNPSMAPCAGSMGSGGTHSAGVVGPMTRSLNQSNNLARTSGGEGDRGVGPMTKRLSGSGGGAPPANSPGVSGPVSVVRAMHEWLWRTVIFLHDDRHPMVWYDAEVGAFQSAESTVCSTGKVGAASSASLASATSVRELSLIFELFGPCAASDLTRGCDQLIHSCLEEIQAYLEVNQAPLQDLLDAAHLPLDKRFAAVSRVLPSLAPPSSGSSSVRGPQCLKGLTDTVLRLGRCLALRMQLGRAAATAAERTADFVTLALREMASPVNVCCGDVKPPVADGEADVAVGTNVVTPHERRDWAALVRLSSGSSSGDVDCGYCGCLLPERDDIVLTARLAMLLPSLPAAQRWHRLPALMAALMAAPQWSVGVAHHGAAQLASRGSKGSTTPRVGPSQPAGALPPSSVVFAPLGAINTVAVALSLSLQEAMSQVLHPAASQFLMGCGTPVAAMLCAYQRTALAVAQAAAVGAGADCTSAATAAKQHMLASLEQIPLLRNYSYMVPYTPEEAAAVDSATVESDAAQPADGPPIASAPLSGSLELSQSWWASGSSVGLSLNGLSQPLHKTANALVHVEQVLRRTVTDDLGAWATNTYPAGLERLPWDVLVGGMPCYGTVSNFFAGCATAGIPDAILDTYSHRPSGWNVLFAAATQIPIGAAKALGCRCEAATQRDTSSSCSCAGHSNTSANTHIKIGSVLFRGIFDRLAGCDLARCRAVHPTWRAWLDETTSSSPQPTTAMTATRDVELRDAGCSSGSGVGAPVTRLWLNAAVRDLMLCTWPGFQLQMEEEALWCDRTHPLVLQQQQRPIVPRVVQGEHSWPLCGALDWPWTRVMQGNTRCTTGHQPHQQQQRPEQQALASGSGSLQIPPQRMLRVIVRRPPPPPTDHRLPPLPLQLHDFAHQPQFGVAGSPCGGGAAFRWYSRLQRLLNTTLEIEAAEAGQPGHRTYCHYLEAVLRERQIAALHALQHVPHALRLASSYVQVGRYLQSGGAHCGRFGTTLERAAERLMCMCSDGRVLLDWDMCWQVLDDAGGHAAAQLSSVRCSLALYTHAADQHLADVYAAIEAVASTLGTAGELPGQQHVPTLAIVALQMLRLLLVARHWLRALAAMVPRLGARPALADCTDACSAAGNKEVLCDISTNRLDEAVKRLEQVRERGDALGDAFRKPKDVSVQAEIFRTLAGYGVEASNKLVQQQQGRGPLELIRALRARFVYSSDPQRDGETNPSAFSWYEFAAATEHLRRPAHGAHCLIGALDVKPKERKAPVQRQKRPELEVLQRPEVHIAMPVEDKKETDRNMETMWTIVKAQAEPEVQVAKLVCNHASFGQTLENLFTLSFLVRDNRVGMKKVPGAGLLVWALDPRRGDAAGRQQKPPLQFVVTLHIDDWVKMCSRVTPEECLMPHRDYGMTKDQSTAATGKRRQSAAADGPSTTKKARLGR
ncbi:hypothetical protein VOLCADRAFT_107742 [Volvox carteri f. nagariensis]|uniref:Non-structural maintenance of chromosome element 4 C-terminal domain-containing protein n=1 Tax=Volvox carteri f. nagariensis TaxID=3068 RepID=D8UG06_VOLCA|nr:uncharacterized protein VOLCADRAFT_107742 [Volvox carteri f. nagariensis]EFJ41345.1 hypothetical protein VOLCADRAFT_107742 [Volvox carteri f. nagariensis]|eukprot:XP_002957575.1 hypothetical protein VOLCADRAFT_107742 [Volvox carteri f. nagariensis]